MGGPKAAGPRLTATEAARLAREHSEDVGGYAPGEYPVPETRVRDPRTGGEKGRKILRYDLLPWDVIEEDARLYGVGAQKYDERNWERGYKMSLSMAALMRHLTAYWQARERDDPETGCHHLAAVRFHAAAMMRFEREHPEMDDRPAPTPPPEPENETTGKVSVRDIAEHLLRRHEQDQGWRF